MKAGDPLLRWRKEFPILESSTYLISNSLGAMPRDVRTNLKAYADLWSEMGVRAWGESWWEMPVSVGDRIAALIGAKRGEVSMHANISLLQSIIISCFTFNGKRKKIVTTEMEFPSTLYVYEKFAAELGAKVEIVRSVDGRTIPTEAIIDAIDEHTLLVPISHVLFKSAYIQDIEAIVERAHRCGALVVLDTYHSVGVVPVDVRKLGVDILVGGVLKWLCGGPGGAFLWVRPSLRKSLQPKITGWVAHKHPFAFASKMEYRDDAFKFLNGTPSIPSLYAALAGPTIIGTVGVGRIRRKSIRQTALIIGKSQEMGFDIRSPLKSEERGGTVTIDVPHGYRVSRELLRRNIIVDYREGSGIRIAPHFYTTDDELLFALSEINAILTSKAYRRHSPQKSRVT